MTSETRTYIELSDIMAIEFPCSACRAAVTVPLHATEKAVSPPGKCPNCNSVLLPDGTTPEGKRIEALIRTLRFAADQDLGLGLGKYLRLQVKCGKE